MGCSPAPACTQALTEATSLWPNRSKASDGICASAQHHKNNPNSDHDLGNAFDLTHDPAHGVNCPALVSLLISRRDQRVKYIIHNRLIYNRTTGFVPKPYLPKPGMVYNPHTTHMHVSILSSARGDTSPWFGGASSMPAGEQQPPGTTDQPAPAPAADSSSWWGTFSAALGLTTDIALTEAERQLPAELQQMIAVYRKLSDGRSWVALATFLAGGLAVGAGVTLMVADSRAADVAVGVVKAVV